MQASLPRRNFGEGGHGVPADEGTAAEWSLEDVVALVADPGMLRSGHTFRDASRANIDSLHTLYRQHHPAAAAVAPVADRKSVV